MALRLRRGTDAERELQRFDEGELIYTTDLKELWIGDGTTLGGTLVTGSGGGLSSTINGLTDTDLTGLSDGDVLVFNSGTNKWEPIPIPGVSALNLNDLTDVTFSVAELTVGDILQYDGNNFTTIPSTSLFQEQQNYKINIVGDDSTILVDTDSNTFTGLFKGDLNAADDTNIIDSVGKVVKADVIGNLSGDATGDHNGTFTGIITATGTLRGEVNGSIFGDDSTMIIDAMQSQVVGSVNNVTTTSSTYAQGANVRIGDNATGNTITLQDNEASSQLIITTQDTGGVVVIPRPLQVGSSSALVGDGRVTIVTGVQNSAGIVLSGHFDDTGNTIATINRSRGTKAVPAAIQNGDGLGSYLLTGYNGTAYRVAGGIKATVAGAPQATYIPSNVEIFVGNSSGTAEVVLQAKQSQKVTEFFGPAKLVSYADTTARDAAVTAPEAGMMIYLTSTNKAQCYDGTSWIDLF
jgi:hypothetical protein